MSGNAYIGVGSGSTLALYAAANVSIAGNGVANANGGAEFHYDEALAALHNHDSHGISSWEELTNAADHSTWLARLTCCSAHGQQLATHRPPLRRIVMHQRSGNPRVLLRHRKPLRHTG